MEQLDLGEEAGSDRAAAVTERLRAIPRDGCEEGTEGYCPQELARSEQGVRGCLLGSILHIRGWWR